MELIYQSKPRDKYCFYDFNRKVIYSAKFIMSFFSNISAIMQKTYKKVKNTLFPTNIYLSIYLSIYIYIYTGVGVFACVFFYLILFVVYFLICELLIVPKYKKKIRILFDGKHAWTDYNTNYN